MDEKMGGWEDGISGISNPFRPFCAFSKAS